MASEPIFYYRNQDASDTTYSQEAWQPGTVAKEIEFFSWDYAGHTFVTWNTARDGSGTNYAPGQTIPATMFYAQWIENKYGYLDGIGLSRVWQKIRNLIQSLPTPMQFKGTVGTSGTIAWSALPMAASSTGFTYKVITDHATAPICKVGDTIISNGTEWVVVPSGDEPSGTVTSVAVSNGGGLSVSGSPITSSGTITISHADTSSQASVSNSGRTYIQSVTLDTYGHVTGLSSATETVTDTNTTYTLNVSGTGDNATKVGLVAGGSGSGTNWYTIPYATSAGTASSANSVAWANVSGHAAGVKADIGIATSGSTFLRKDGTWATPTDTNTTYALSGALSSHKFTSTLTAGGSGSGTSTADLTLVAGSNITLTDDTSNRKITIAATDTNTTYSLAVNGTGDNANKLGLTAGGSGSGTVWVTVPYATTAGSAPSEFVFTDFTVGA